MRHVPGGPAAALLVPRVVLSLIEWAAFYGRYELLRCAAVVDVVGLALSSRRHDRHMMKVVAPDVIEAIPALCGRAHDPRILRLRLGDHQYGPRAGGLPSRHADVLQDVPWRVVVDRVRRVEPQPIQMVLFDPVAHVARDKFAYSFRSVAVEVDRVAPIRGVAAVEIGVGELAQIIAVGSEMVVHDVENHTEARGMRAIHERTQIVARSVIVIGREPVHAVVAPAESAGELRDRHNLNYGHAQRDEILDALGRRGVGALGCERSDVELIEDLPLGLYARPRGVRPAKHRRVDDLRCAMRAIWLVAGRGIWKAAPRPLPPPLSPTTAVQAKAVAATGLEPGYGAGEIAVLIALELGMTVVGFHFDPAALGCPETNVCFARSGQLRAHGQPAPEVTCCG